MNQSVILKVALTALGLSLVATAAPAITEILGDRRFGEAQTRLMIPAWHSKTQKVYIFKTAHHPRLHRVQRFLDRAPHHLAKMIPDPMSSSSQIPSSC